MFSPRTWLLAAAIGSLTPSLLAQTTIRGKLETVGHFGVLAQDGSGRDFRSLPPSSSIAQNPPSLDAFRSNASASTLIGWRVRGNVLSCDISEQGTGNGRALSGTTSGPSSASAQLGPHRLDLTILGAPNLRGRLQVWSSGVAQSGSKVRLAAQVRGNPAMQSSLDLDSGVQRSTYRQWDTRLDANGQLVVRIETDAQLQLTSGNAVYKTGLSVVFTPGDYCTILDYGSGCGPQLSARDSIAGSSRTVDFSIFDAPASSAGILGFGVQQLRVPIPGTGSPPCFLHVQPLILLPLASDSFGRAKAPFSLPLVAKFQLRSQAFFLPAPSRLVASNGLQVSHR